MTEEENLRRTRVEYGNRRKEIKDFIVATDAGLIGTGPNNGFNGDYAGYTLSTQVNGGAARIRGLEVAYQQQFTSLPGALRGLGAYANYTWLETIGDYESLGDKPYIYIPERKRGTDLFHAQIKAGISGRF